MAHTGTRLRTLLFIVVLISIAVPVAAEELRRVHNGATPRDGIQTVVLKELWRAGGDGDDVFFGRVPRVDTDRHGNIHILDAQLSQVYIYSPDGELLRTAFREGDGPAEARGPRDMLLMPDGGVGLVLEELGMVKFVTATGDPAGSLRIGATEGGNYALVSGAGLDGAVVLSGRRSVAGKTRSIRVRRNFLVRCDLTGAETAAYAEHQTVWDFNSFSYLERDEMPAYHWSFDVGPAGRIFAAVDRDAYEITVYKADGTPELVIDREYKPLMRTKADRDRFIHMIETSMEGMPFETKVDLEDTYPAISILQRGLQVTADGSLWVLCARGMKPDEPEIMAVYDVFDTDGLFVRQVAMAAPHDAAQVGIVLAEGNRVIVIKGFLESLASQFGNGASFNGEEWSTPEVIVYEMVGR
jgi:hypothetical protein